MYFKEFPKLYYDFPNLDNGTFLQVLTDITANVRVRKKVLEDISLFDTYIIKDYETPEIIAEKIYGNPEYHWTIMLANQRYDHINDFPKSQPELEEHIESIYGDEKYNVHHYEDSNGLYAEAIASIVFTADDVGTMQIGDHILEDPWARAKIISIDNVTVTVKIDYGRFKENELIALAGAREDSNGVLVWKVYGNAFIKTGAVTTNSNYKIITNYEYEHIENEKKREIKIISPRLISQVVREYMDIMG